MLRLFYVCTVLDPPLASICGNGGCEEDMMPIKLIVIDFMHKVYYMRIFVCNTSET